MLEKAKQVSAVSKPHLPFPLFVILGVFLYGITPVIFLWKRAQKINEALGADVIPKWVVTTQLTLLCVSLSGRFIGYSTDDGYGDFNIFYFIGNLTAFAMGVIWVVHAFIAKSVLENVVQNSWGLKSYELNGLLTFFFSLFYIIHRLNSLERDVQPLTQQISFVPPSPQSWEASDEVAAARQVLQAAEARAKQKTLEDEVTAARKALEAAESRAKQQA